MENWRIVILSVACTLAIEIILIMIIAVIQSGVISAIEEDFIDNYCSEIPLNVARDLEVCNEF